MSLIDPSFPAQMYGERLRAAEAARLAIIVGGRHPHCARQVTGDLLIRAGLWLWLHGELTEPGQPATSHPN